MTSSRLHSILYVDDDSDLRTMVNVVLTAMGNFKVLACNSGKRALAETTRFEPDLLLLDVIMPDLDGPATLMELRKRKMTADTPVIFLTANLADGDQEYYRSLGAIGVIEKPFEPLLLADQVWQIWDQNVREKILAEKNISP